LYTVKEVSELSHVTIKTLHHYHKIGLLLPCRVSEAGYRLYGTKELERLQEILFFRELEFPLDQIKEILEQPSGRLSVLLRQEELLLRRKHRLDTILQTLRHSITFTKEGISMSDKEMFQGFANEQQWNDALTEHNRHLAENYGIAPMEIAPEDVPGMNEQASEAAAFMREMASALREGIKHNDEKIGHLIRCHLRFLNEHGLATSADDFAGQTRFFLDDDFHLSMLEGQQTGLAYYLAVAAESFAATTP